jgi:hypothetical protein
MKDYREDSVKQEKQIERLEWAVESDKEEWIQSLMVMEAEWVDLKMAVEKHERMAEDSASQMQVETSTADGYPAIPRDQQIIVIGSSMARGVGQGLKVQHGKVRIMSKSGGVISDTAAVLDGLDLDGTEQIVVMVGGNNIDRGDGSEDIVKEYRVLLDKLRDKNRNVTVVGPSTRRHYNQYTHSKTIGINRRLRQMCSARNMDYIEAGLTKDEALRMLARDGVHYNRDGVQEVGRRVYKSIQKRLNCRRERKEGQD